MAIQQISLEKQLATDYLTYAFSTLNRSIPDAIDGLLISQRRIIDTMFSHNMSDWHKTASVAGLVMAERHPHGDCSSSIYNLASKASNMHPLIDIYGNAGGYIIEGDKAGQLLSDDGPASPRYTKAKLSEFARAIFDIEPNLLVSEKSYTNKHTEIRQYVPALPLTLLNGQQGIGVGYACNSISFNLASVVHAIKYAMANNRSKAEEALGMPDLPCFSLIQQDDAISQLNENGRATFRLRGKYAISDIKLPLKRNAWRKQIEITELPSGSAERFLGKLANERITTISDATDYSNSAGINIVLIGKNGCSENDILQELFRYTNLTDTYSANNTFVLDGKPISMTPYDLIINWLEARRDILREKYNSLKKEAESRLHILSAIIRLMPEMQAIAQAIIACNDEIEAEAMLIANHDLDSKQAKAILSISLKQLVKLSADQLMKEQEQLLLQSKHYDELLTNRATLDLDILATCQAIKKQFASSRKTALVAELPEIKQQQEIDNKLTPRQEFLAESRLTDVLNKTLYKQYMRGKLPKPISGRTLSATADLLAKELDDLYDNKQLSHEHIKQFAIKLGLKPLDNKWAKRMLKDRERLEWHIQWSIK